MTTVRLRHIEATHKIEDLLKLGVNACNRAAKSAGDDSRLRIVFIDEPGFPGGLVLGVHFDIWAYDSTEIEFGRTLSNLADENGIPVGGDTLLALFYEYAPAVAKKLFINPDTMEVKLRKSVQLYTD